MHFRIFAPILAWAAQTCGSDHIRLDFGLKFLQLLVNNLSDTMARGRDEKTGFGPRIYLMVAHESIIIVSSHNSSANLTSVNSFATATTQMLSLA
jgi:hypothetical protein